MRLSTLHCLLFIVLAVLLVAVIYRLPWSPKCSGGVADVFHCNTTDNTSMLTTAEIVVSENIDQNRKLKFADGTIVYTAAPQYIENFIADVALAVLYAPQFIPTADITNQLSKFSARINVNGEMPSFISQDQKITHYYGSAFQTYAIPDAPYSFPILMNELYRRTSNWATVTPYVPALVSALNAIPKDATTLCPRIIAGAEGNPYGFHDAVRGTGVDGLGCVFYTNAARLLYTYYSSIGDPTSASLWNTRYTNTLSALQGSMYDSMNGMIYAYSGQNHQDDIAATAMAQFFHLLTKEQTTAFSTYLIHHYSAISKYGYFRLSPTNWTYKGVVPASGGPPYLCDTGHPGTDCYGTGTYDDGYWSWFTPGIAQAIFNSGAGSLATLTQLFSDLNANIDPTMEYYAPGGKPSQGYTGNLESPTGWLYALGYPYNTANDPQGFARQAHIERASPSARMNLKQHHAAEKFLSTPLAEVRVLGTRLLRRIQSVIE